MKKVINFSLALLLTMLCFNASAGTNMTPPDSVVKNKPGKAYVVEVDVYVSGTTFQTTGCYKLSFNSSTLSFSLSKNAGGCHSVRWIYDQSNGQWTRLGDVSSPQSLNGELEMTEDAKSYFLNNYHSILGPDEDPK